MKRQQSLTYLFKEQLEELLYGKKIRRSIRLLERTPTNSKKYLGGDLSLETLIILEKIFSFVKKFDKTIKDPVWETVSLKIKKYIPFININIVYYKKILRKIVNE